MSKAYVSISNRTCTKVRADIIEYLESEHLIPVMVDIPYDDNKERRKMENCDYLVIAAPDGSPITDPESSDYMTACIGRGQYEAILKWKDHKDAKSIYVIGADMQDGTLTTYSVEHQYIWDNTDWNHYGILKLKAVTPSWIKIASINYIFSNEDISVVPRIGNKKYYYYVR